MTGADIWRIRSDTLDSRFVRYGVPLASVASALLVTQLIVRDVYPETSALFIAAVMVSAFYGGSGPGLVSTILATLALNYYLTSPAYSLKISVASLVHSSLFLFPALLISLLGGIQRRLTVDLQAENKARASEKEVRRELLHRLVNAQEEERRRISRELHDQMGQYLAALMWGLQSLKDSTHVQPPARKDIERLGELAQQLDYEVDHLVLELRPTVLDDVGLHSALVQHFERWSEHSKVVVSYRIAGIEHQRLPASIETPIYRVVQEALTNVLKHARTKRVSLTLERRKDHVLTIIEDNGCGFDSDALERASNVHTRLGLLGMRERVEMAGGTLNVESTPGKGTSVFVRIPLMSNGNGGVPHE